MAVIGLDHVQLAMPAGREQAARDFYAGLLGLTEVAKPAHLTTRGGCWFEQGAVKVHLGIDKAFVPAGKAHPAFLVDDLFAMLGRLSEFGIPIDRDQPLDGYERCYITDPFGNRIELMQPQPATEGR